jgi:cytochrome c-type biogenesis protein CcmH
MLIMFLVFMPIAWASVPHQFERVEDQIRFQSLVKSFRCVTCQNQNLSESNAPVAEVMRDEIARQLRAGKTDQDIEDFLVERYGDFVLYRPPLKAHTLALWLAPILIAVAALGSMIWTVVIKKEKSNVGK